MTANANRAGVVLHESQGLWVMRQPWPEAQAWCENGGGGPASVVYDLYVYYDAPHEDRVKRLGASFEVKLPRFSGHSVKHFSSVRTLREFGAR